MIEAVWRNNPIASGFNGNKRTMSVNLSAIIDKLVESAPPGELKSVKKNLDIIAAHENTSIINKSLEKYIENNFVVLSGQYIAGKLNKDAHSTKFWDYIGKQKFNVDSKNERAIDFESADPEVEYPDYFDGLVERLELYGNNHYPSNYAFTIIPHVDKTVEVVIIGEKVNVENYFSGRWQSVYRVTVSGAVTGHVNLDIHYYEDGNVRLNFEEPIKDALNDVSASGIVNFINNFENDLTMKIVEQFNTLNQNSFKNLRRLLPVTKSKINWGKAIGTYRLGSDVVNQ